MPNGVDTMADSDGIKSNQRLYEQVESLPFKRLENYRDASFDCISLKYESKEQRSWGSSNVLYFCRILTCEIVRIENDLTYAVQNPYLMM